MRGIPHVVAAWLITVETASAAEPCSPGLSVPGDLPTIQAAIDAAPPSGGVICVDPGVYAESPTVPYPKSVHLQGAQAGVPAVTFSGGPNKRGGGPESEIRGTFTSNSDDVILDGFIVTSPAFSIWLAGYDNVARNNILDGRPIRPSSGFNGGVNVTAPNPARPNRYLLEDNWVEGGRYGLSLSGGIQTQNSIVRRNYIRDVERAVQTYAGVTGAIAFSRNFIEEVTGGFRLAQGGHHLVGNTIRNLIGGSVEPVAIRAFPGARGLDITRNSLSDSDYGIYVSGVSPGAPNDYRCNNLVRHPLGSLVVATSGGASINATWNWWGDETGPAPGQIQPDGAVVTFDPWHEQEIPEFPAPCPPVETATSTMVSDSELIFGDSVSDAASVTGDADDGAGGYFDPDGYVQFYGCYGGDTGPTSCDASSGTPLGDPIALDGGADPADGLATAELPAFEPGASGYTRFFAQYLGSAIYAPSGDDGENELFHVEPAEMFIRFDGQYIDEDGPPTQLAATVSGGPSECYDGATVNFDYQNLLTGATGSTSGTTDGSGVASVVQSLDRGAVYDVSTTVEARDFAGTDAPECMSAWDSGTTVVADPNAASTGGGWYKAPRATPPKVNFGYVVNAKIDRRTGVTTISGAINWINNNTHRLKGTISSYGKVACSTVGTNTFRACAQVSGTGTVWEYNDAYDPEDPGSEEWINPVTSPFTFLAYDGGTASASKKGGPKQQKPDAFGMRLDGVAIDAESTPVLLSGGNLTVK
jgi:hypothetical protein